MTMLVHVRTALAAEVVPSRLASQTSTMSSATHCSCAMPAERRHPSAVSKQRWKEDLGKGSLRGARQTDMAVPDMAMLEIKEPSSGLTLERSGLAMYPWLIYSARSRR